MEYSTYHADFYQQLVAATARAKANTPASEHSRLRKGAESACDGKVVVHADGSATVHSDSRPGLLHVIMNCQCSCEAAQHQPTRRCSHRWAARLYVEARRASQPKDWQNGMYSEEVRQAKYEAGELAATVCTPEHGLARWMAGHTPTAGK